VEKDKVKPGICYMCTLSCAIRIHISQGRATLIDMVDRNVAAICPRWKAMLDFVYHPERLKYPLKRVGKRGGGSFKRITWDEALDTVADNLRKIKEKYGPESVVFYIGYTKEPRPYFHRLAHAFGSPNYCTESSNCNSSQWLATRLTYGPDYTSISERSKVMEPATRCALVWSSSIINSAPGSWAGYQQARQNGLKLIVVDPYRTALADMADIHLQLRPGTDGALALGMINVIISNNLYDKEFVEKWTTGFPDLVKLAGQYPPEQVEKITWVPASKVRSAALLYAGTGPAKLTLSANATTHHSNGLQNHRAIILLAALTGNFDVAGGNQAPAENLPMNDITLHDERISGMPLGLGSDRFPIWTKMYREMASNLIAGRIGNGEPYPIKAIFGAGLNIMYFPNSNGFAESLEKLDFMVMTEYFQTPTTRYADIILPIASWLERPILLTRKGGFVSLLEPAIKPVGGSWHEFQIYAGLAGRLDFGAEFWQGDFDRCVDYILEPSGLNVAELRKHPQGMLYPVPARSAKHYEEAGFQTPSGKVEIASSILEKHGLEALPVYQEPVASPLSRPDLSKTYPLVLTTGARRLAYTHSQFRDIERLRRLEPDPVVEINPADARARGIKNGDTASVSSPRGTITVITSVTDKVLAGVVQVPHQWPGAANVNILISDEDLDPVSGFAPLKSSLCQVKKA